MQFDRRGFLAVFLGLGACTTAPVETARLPEFNNFLSIDPVRYSIDQGAYLLTNPNTLTGQPWEVARLVQGLECKATHGINDGAGGAGRMARGPWHRGGCTRSGRD